MALSGGPDWPDMSPIHQLSKQRGDMNKHLALITAAVTLLVPATSAQAASVKSKLRFGASAYAVAEDGGSATLTAPPTRAKKKAPTRPKKTAPSAYPPATGSR